MIRRAAAGLALVAIVALVSALVVAMTHDQMHRIDVYERIITGPADSPAKALVCAEYRRWSAQARETVDGMEEQCR